MTTTVTHREVARVVPNAFFEGAESALGQLAPPDALSREYSGFVDCLRWHALSLTRFLREAESALGQLAPPDA
jgi:hypothetical protein